MNLVQAADDITYVPTELLAGMIDNPNSRFPSFLVLSEVQRRNLDKRAYDAEVMAKNKPSTTVAQEAVAELTGTGLAGALSDQPLSSPIGESPVGGGVPASSGLGGMQMMAGGGRTGYSSRGLVEQALGYDPNLKDLRNRPEFGVGLDQLYKFADDPALGLAAYNRRIGRFRPTGPLNYGGDVLTGLQADREQKEAAIEAIIKRANELGVPIGSVQDIYSLDPDEKGQKFSTFVPEGADYSGGFELPKTEIETNTDNLFAGTDLSQTPILDGESREEFGPSIERLTGETESQSDFDTARKQAESLYSGLNYPNLKEIKTDTSGLQGMLEGMPEFDRSKYQIDFDAPTAEDRAKDRQIAMLGGLSQVLGSAKNLGEFGSGVGTLAKDIQGMRKEARKEDLDLAKQRVQTEIAIDSLAKGDREEKVLLNKTILQLEQADNVAEQNRILKMYEIQSNRAGKELQATVDLLKNKTQEDNITRLTEQGRLELYKEENDKLKDIATQMSTAMPTEKKLLMDQYKEQKSYVDQIARVVRKDQYPDIDFSSTDEKADMTADQYLGIKK